MQNDFISIWKIISESEAVIIVVPGENIVQVNLLGLVLQKLININIPDKPVKLHNLNPLAEDFKNTLINNSFDENLGEKELVISFDISKKQIEKISYDDNSEKLNLIIQTRKGVPAISKQQVNFNYRGINSDLIIFLGIDKLKMFESLTQKETDILQHNILVWGYRDLLKTPVLSKIITPPGQLVVQFIDLMQQNKLKLDLAITDNLFKALKYESRDFSQANANIFQKAAWLMQTRDTFQGSNSRLKSDLDLESNYNSNYSSTTPLIASSQFDQDNADWLKPKIFKSSD